MGRLQTGLLWRLITLLLLISQISTFNLCETGTEGNGKPATLCATPYCSCNNPYGRIYCSCIPYNSAIPQVHELTLQSRGPCHIPPEAIDLIVENCLNVTFAGNGLEDLRSLKSVQVTNVSEVTVEKNAFHWNASNSGLSVLFTNTTVANLPSFAFSGKILRVIFRGVYLGLTRSFAFSSITDTECLQFIDCNFANIEPQSFKKFSTNDFIVENSRFHIIPSRFLHEVHVHNLFRMDSNFIDVARTYAFHVHHASYTIISNNRVNSLEGEAFVIEVLGPVKIQDNYFESIEPAAFKGIITKRKLLPVKYELHFHNNTLESFTESSFIFNKEDFNVHLTRMLVDDTCTCDNLVHWRDVLFPNKKHPSAPIEADLTEVWCHEDTRKEINYVFISGESFYEDHCTQLISSIYFFVIIIVTTAVGLCVLILVCICILRRRRQWDSVPTSEVQGVVAKKPDPKKKGLVVPDGRVYRETEFHVIVEKVEPMDEVVPYRVTRDRSRTMFTKELPG